MKRLKKGILWTVGILVVLLAVTLVVVIFFLGNVIKSTLEQVGPRYTGGPVTLEAAQVRPLRGKAMLKGLVIGNPEGFGTDSAIELGEFRIDMDPRSVTTPKVLVREILIDGPIITFEMKGVRDSNLAAIQRNAQAAAPAPKPTDPGAAPAAKPRPDTGDPAKQVVIENLIIRNGKIRFSSGLLQGGAINLPLPTIHLKDIGKEKDTTIAEAFTLVLSEVVNTVIAVVMKAPDLAGKGLKLLGGATLDVGRLTGQAATNLAGGAVDIVGGVAGGAASAAGGLAEGTAAAVGGVASGAADLVGGVAGGTADLVGGGAAAAGEGLKRLGSSLGGLRKKAEVAAADAAAVTNVTGESPQPVE